MSVPEAEPDRAAVREIRVGVFCTAAEVQELAARVAALLCPDPEHPSPCPVPWSISVIEEAEGYPELVEQAAIPRQCETAPSREAGGRFGGV